MTIITEKHTVNFTVSHVEGGNLVPVWCDFFDNFPTISKLSFSKRSGWSFTPDSSVRAMSEAALRTAFDYWESECQQAGWSLLVEGVGPGVGCIYLAESEGETVTNIDYFMTAEEATEQARMCWSHLLEKEKTDPHNSVSSWCVRLADLTCNSGLECTWDYSFWGYDGNFESKRWLEEREAYQERKEKAEPIAEAIRYADDWSSVSTELEELCKLAGMEVEWQQADGDTFESVAEAAADELGVEIY